MAYRPTNIEPIDLDADMFCDRELVLIYQWIAQHEADPAFGWKCALVRLAFGSGLRVAELAALKIKDIIPDRGMVIVRRGKGGKARRVRVIPELEPYLARWVVGRDPEEPLFRGRGGKHPSTRWLQLAWEDIIRAVSLDNQWTVQERSIHKARHTYASHELAWRRLNMFEVAAMLGHSSISTTQRYYLHVGMEALYRDKPKWWASALAGVGSADNVIPIKRTA